MYRAAGRHALHVTCRPLHPTSLASLGLRRALHAWLIRWASCHTTNACSYMEGGRIVFSGSPDEMRAYMRRLGALV